MDISTNDEPGMEYINMVDVVVVNKPRQNPQDFYQTTDSDSEESEKDNPLEGVQELFQQGGRQIVNANRAPPVIPAQFLTPPDQAQQPLPPRAPSPPPLIEEFPKVDCRPYH